MTGCDLTNNRGNLCIYITIWEGTVRRLDTKPAGQRVSAPHHDRQGVTPTSVYYVRKPDKRLTPTAQPVNETCESWVSSSYSTTRTLANVGNKPR